MATETSDSGRTVVTTTWKDDGSVQINVKRDGRQAGRFELNRELELVKEE